MDVRGLVPWGRNRNVAARYSGDENPFLALHREMNRMFDDFTRGFDLPVAQGGWTGAWPRVELSETDKAVRVVAGATWPAGEGYRADVGGQHPDAQGREED